MKTFNDLAELTNEEISALLSDPSVIGTQDLVFGEVDR